MLKSKKIVVKIPNRDNKLPRRMRTQTDITDIYHVKFGQLQTHNIKV